jgi:hypothetical protein
VLTLHGSQFRNADLIVASPPCQGYSYRAMPWKRAKALPPPDNTLFESCFRIQREACAAAGRHIPLIVENVRGAQKWVGRARWNYGSFYLWGDVPALMPPISSRAKLKGGDAGWRERGPGRQLQDSAIKNLGRSWFNVAHNTTNGKGRNPDGRKVPDRIVHIRDGAPHTRHLTNPFEHEGIKVPGRGAKGWFGSYAEQKATGTISPGRMHGKNHPKRKFASAMIAKIPEPLSRFIARTFYPGRLAEAAE